jgi:hypothetical protein
VISHNCIDGEHQHCGGNIKSANVYEPDLDDVVECGCQCHAGQAGDKGGTVDAALNPGPPASTLEGMSDREKLIRDGFCVDSDRDCDAVRYLLGVIDTIRWDRRLLREDRERMDWLERNWLIVPIVWRYVDGTFTLRMAVDFAMKQKTLHSQMMRDEWLRVTGLAASDLDHHGPPPDATVRHSGGH